MTHQHGTMSNKDKAIQAANIALFHASHASAWDHPAMEHEAAQICADVSPSGMQWKWDASGAIEFYYGDDHGG